MVVHPLISELGEGLILRSLWFREFSIEKALAVFGPARLRKFDPFDDVRELLLRVDVTNSDFVPIRAAGCDAVGQQTAIVTYLRACHRDRPIARELIRIQ